MIYFLSHLTSFAQNFLIKGMIFAVFFGIAIGLIVFLVSRHELTAFERITTDDVGRSIAYGLLAMAVIMVMIFAFTMAAQEVGIKKALFKKLDTNYPLSLIHI